MKKALIILLNFICISSYSQVSFQRGYFIDNEGDTISAFIKNEVWRTNPSEFKYRISEGSESKTGVVDEVREISVPGQFKYRRFNTRIDRSPDEISDVTTNRNPVFEDGEFLLKTLVEGTATLYFYNDGEIRRFFYSVNGSDVEQLIYKRYETVEGKIARNNRFRQQLWNTVRCSSSAENSLVKMDYRRQELVRYFTRYNDCVNSTFVDYTRRNEDVDYFRITAKLGAIFSSMKLGQDGYRNTIKGEMTSSLRVGVEAEYLFPFLRNKWSMFAEPSYYSFRNDMEGVVYNNNPLPSNPNATGGARGSFLVDYSVIEVPIGFRYYFYLNDQSRIFLNSGVAYEIFLDSSTKVTSEKAYNLKTEFDVEQSELVNIFLGAGYSYRNYSIEARYYVGKTYATDDWTFVHDNYFMVGLGYKVF